MFKSIGGYQHQKNVKKQLKKEKKELEKEDNDWSRTSYDNTAKGGLLNGHFSNLFFPSFFDDIDSPSMLTLLNDISDNLVRYSPVKAKAKLLELLRSDANQILVLYNPN